jgi:uncharacterized delta-60 repeat protein
LVVVTTAVVALMSTAAFAATLFPDRSFSGDGSKLVGFGRICCAEPFALAIDGRGRIVAAGNSTSEPEDPHIAVARVLQDGRPDPTFSGDGRRTIDLTSKTDVFEAALAVLPAGNGRVFVGGVSGDISDPVGFVLRLTARGRLDPTFSSDGVHRVRRLSSVDSLAPGPDGSLYAAGQAGGFNQVIRLDDDGDLDFGFGDRGVAVADFGDSVGSPVIDVMGDRVVLATSYGDPRSGWELGVARFLPTGSADSQFAGDGTTLVDLSSGSERIGDVGVGRNGRITLIAGTFDGEVGLARLLGTGEPDPSFGQAGEVVARYDQRSRFRLGSGIVLPSGAVIVGGSLHAETAKVALARFRPDGTLDPSFGDGGWRLRRPGRRLYAPLLAIGPDRRPVMAAAEPYGFEGSSVAGFRLLRVLAD